MCAIVICLNDEVGLKDNVGLLDEASLMDRAGLMDKASFFFFFLRRGYFSPHQLPPHYYLCLCDKVGIILKLCLPHFSCARVYCGMVRRLTT